MALIVVVVVAIVAYVWINGHKPDFKRRTVLAGLQPADRMELEPGSLKDWNVLLISLDTTRADHLNCYGYAGTKTPTLNRLARHGVLYSEAITPVPTTLPAHSSLLTGLYPFHHGVRANLGFKLEDKNVTLAEVLRQSGYQTGAVISAFVLDSQFGIDQGFDTYNDDLTVGVQHSKTAPRERSAEQTNVPAVEWLREHGKEKFFYWVHYYDPHLPYVPPEPYRSRYAKARYDGEIEYADEQIGKLLGVLDEIGVRERTLIVFVGDHGEGLGQHNEKGHGLLIYDSTMHVPMIFSAPPPFPQGQVVHDQVSLVDVMPTILDLLGLPAQDDSDGITLLEKTSDGRSSVYIETILPKYQHGWAPLIGLRRLDHKLILAPESELYDLQLDPGEKDNLHQSESELAKELFEELANCIGMGDPYMATVVEQNLDMDEESLRKLETLGYVGGGGAGEEPPQSLPDPKKMIVELKKYHRARKLRDSGRVTEAIGIFEDLLNMAPGDTAVRIALADCYSFTVQYDKAAQIIDTGLQLAPDNGALLCEKAKLMMIVGKPEKAKELYRQVQEAYPENLDTLLGLAKISRIQGKADEAIAMFEEVIKINPGNGGPSAYNQIGIIHLRAGRWQEARQAFRAALKINAKNVEAHSGLAMVLISEKKIDEAIERLQLALKLDPVELPNVARLAACYREKGDLRPAAVLCRKALAINPRHAQTLGTIALVYHQQNKFEQGQEHYRKAVGELKRLLVGDPNNKEVLRQLARIRRVWPPPLEAIKGYNDILAKEPDSVPALLGRAYGLMQLGRHAEAVADFEKALKILPDDPQILNNLAWVLATSPEDKLRDGRRAVELAEKACRATDYTQAHFLGTLAAAYAEADDFPKAVQWSTQALKIASEIRKPALAKELASYKAGKPWREMPGAEPAQQPSEKSQ